jgi:hypothetical protein
MVEGDTGAAADDGGARKQPDLEASIDEAMAQPTNELVATRHGGGIATATCPQKFTCDDNRLYAVKFVENQHGDGRGVFNEQVIAALGVLVGAPVAPVALVRVPQDLIDELNASAATNHLNFQPSAGVHHGSRWQDNYSGRQAVDHVDENRELFGALDVLHAWTGCSGDQQWIYHNDPPHTVLSTDHTTFFPDGFGWSKESVAAQHAGVTQDPVISAIGLTPSDRRTALDRLAAVDAAHVAAAVARPPASWGVSKEDRVALAEFLLARKDAVTTLLS